MIKQFVLSFFAIVLLIVPNTCVLFGVQDSTFEKEKLNNWHQWRGPQGDGVAPNGNPPVTWDASTNIKWKTAIPGEGISTPIVWNKKIYLTYAMATDRKLETARESDPRAKTVAPANFFEFFVVAVELESGDIVWKKKLAEAVPHEGRHQTSTYAAASPMTDGDRLLVSFGSYGIFCLDMQGNILWERDLGDMRTRRGWGEAVSPVIHGNRAIVNWDQEDQSSIFVLNLKNGKTVWENERDEPTTWATPLVVARNGISQLITNGTSKVRSYDLKDGKIIWQSEGTTLNAIPSPVIFADHVICMAGYRGNSAISVNLDSQGEVEAKKGIRWKLNRDTPYVPSPLLSGNRLYFTKSNAAILNCVNADSGKPYYEQVRLPDLRGLYASPVAASGRVYICSREGTTIVLEDGEKFKVLATNRLDDPINASPVVVGNKLLLRGRNTLYCIQDTSK